ncbi:tol-pal system protein YbgF [Candidatus Magnetominusculus xianensis]|uniref:Tol-pal system protein YbgF n=1 Tax=Candidatus Magnetominusculus xianensis TaxID=1748249 RepID=A0ABR5SFH9_9BACT|nr:tol-pal system protein YbgF [Candidatus Magnetominusculus xianensis]KWT84398.1 tol-pal system protein YbgF [Candidatus Magnetominusculus xianensis]MBF0404232.1 tol-pal system protein YbgF [Nitrospirota bacterium]
MLQIIKLLPVLLILLMASCATDDFARLRGEVNELKRVQSQQKDDVLDIQRRLSISDTQKGKADMLNAIRESQENLNSKVTNMSRELQQLYGRVEERKFYVDRSLADSKSERDLLKSQLDMMTGEITDLRGRVERVEVALQKKGIAVTPPDSLPTPKTSAPVTKEPVQPTPPPPPPAEPPVQHSSPKAMYDDAMKDYNSGKHKESREKFSRLIKEFPTSSLAASGNFWIGESYYKEGSYEDAILSYDVVVKKYPNSDKVPGAKLKQALAFIEIKDPKPARTILQQIIDDYPNSVEAEQAKKHLKLLGNPAPVKKSEPTKKTRIQ